MQPLLWTLPSVKHLWSGESLKRTWSGIDNPNTSPVRTAIALAWLVEMALGGKHTLVVIKAINRTNRTKAAGLLSCCSVCAERGLMRRIFPEDRFGKFVHGIEVFGYTSNSFLILVCPRHSLESRDMLICL